MAKQYLIFHINVHIYIVIFHDNDEVCIKPISSTMHTKMLKFAEEKHDKHEPFSARLKVYDAPLLDVHLHHVAPK